MHRLTTQLLSNRPPLWCMVWPTLAPIWSLTCQIPKYIDAVLNIYTKENSVTGSPASWTIQITYKAVLFQQHIHFQGWHGQNTAIEYPLRDLALQQTLWPHNTSALQPFTGGYSCIWHTLQHKSYNSWCSHCCQTAWASIPDLIYGLLTSSLLSLSYSCIAKVAFNLTKPHCPSCNASAITG